MSKGRLSIGRINSNMEDDYISIDVEDTNSRTHFLTMKLSLEDMMLALTGCSGIAVEMEFRGLNRLGKVRETKTEFIQGAIGYKPDAYVIESLLMSYEVDGWEARRSDFENSKHYVTAKDGTLGWNVVFERYIDGPGT